MKFLKIFSFFALLFPASQAIALEIPKGFVGICGDTEYNEGQKTPSGCQVTFISTLKSSFSGSMQVVVSGEYHTLAVNANFYVTDFTQIPNTVSAVSSTYNGRYNTDKLFSLFERLKPLGNDIRGSFAIPNDEIFEIYVRGVIEGIIQECMHKIDDINTISSENKCITGKIEEKSGELPIQFGNFSIYIS